MIYFASPGNFPIVRPLFRPFSLSFLHISTNFHTHCFFHKFSSSSVNSSSTSYIHFLSPSRSFQLFGLLFQSIYSAYFFLFFHHSRPFPWEFFTLLGIFFQPIFQLLRYFPSNVSPKAFQPISQFLLCHSEKKGTTSKRVAWITESILLRLKKLA